MKMFPQKVLSAAVVFALLSAGCGVLIIPSRSNEGQIDLQQNVITREKDGFRVSVRSMSWDGYPYYLDQYYTPFFVTVRNERKSPVRLTYGAFSLLDNRGNQYSVVSPEKVWEVLFDKRAPLAYSPYPYSPYYYDRYYWYERYPIPPYPYYYPYYYPPYYSIPPAEEYAEHNWGRKDVVLEGLMEGDVMSGAQVSGFVYFKKATSVADRLDMRFTLEGVELSFHFDLLRKGERGRSSRY